MGDIVPSIALINEVKLILEQGQSVRSALDQVCAHPKTSFQQKMYVWWSYESVHHDNPIRFTSIYQQNFIEIIRVGIAGGAIHSQLSLLLNEMKEEFERQWKAYLESLPLKLSFPLLLCFFPAYVTLLFGPLLQQFLKGVGL